MRLFFPTMNRVRSSSLGVCTAALSVSAAAATCTDHAEAVAVQLHKTPSHVPRCDVSGGDFPRQCVRRTLRALPRLTGTRFSLLFGFSLHLRSVSFASIGRVFTALRWLCLLLAGAGLCFCCSYLNPGDVSG